MSHFGHDEMAALQAQFEAGCRRPPPEGPGFTARQSETLWSQVLAFAGYGFNQGHATAYADVSYRSAFLKAHWPAAFLAARLAEWGGFHHPAIYMAEARRLGFAVRPPHVNHSGRRFTLGWEGECAVLWMGLDQVRDLRRNAIRGIHQARRQAPFSDLRDLLRRVPLHPKEVTHLIQCGALDGLGESRAAMLAEAAQIEQAGSVLQMTFAFAVAQSVPSERPAQRLAWERHLLGLPVSVHPLELVADRLPSYLPLRRLPEEPGELVTTAGVRLPGWTGGQGFFVGDGNTFVVAKGESTKPSPPPWQPLLLRGRWLGDEWGTYWLQVDQIDLVQA
jgi:DNA polymerase III alpha subunit